MQTAVRATVSLRQPAHVIKFPDDDGGDDEDDDEDEEAAFYVKQNGKLQYARNRREPAILTRTPARGNGSYRRVRGIGSPERDRGRKGIVSSIGRGGRVRSTW